MCIDWSTAMKVQSCRRGWCCLFRSRRSCIPGATDQFGVMPTSRPVPIVHPQRDFLWSRSLGWPALGKPVLFARPGRAALHIGDGLASPGHAHPSREKRKRLEISRCTPSQVVVDWIPAEAGGCRKSRERFPMPRDPTAGPLAASCSRPARLRANRSLVMQTGVGKRCRRRHLIEAFLAPAAAGNGHRHTTPDQL